MGNFIPVTGTKLKKPKTKMAPHKLVPFATIIALSTLVTLLIKLIRILLKWKYRPKAKLCHFGRPVVKAKVICQKSFVSVTSLKCSCGRIFIPVAEISVAEIEFSVTGVARLLI